jgi:hypothetical protein
MPGVIPRVAPRKIAAPQLVMVSEAPVLHEPNHLNREASFAHKARNATTENSGCGDYFCWLPQQLYHSKTLAKSQVIMFWVEVWFASAFVRIDSRLRRDRDAAIAAISYFPILQYDTAAGPSRNCEPGDWNCAARA